MLSGTALGRERHPGRLPSLTSRFILVSRIPLRDQGLGPLDRTSNFVDFLYAADVLSRDLWLAEARSECKDGRQNSDD